MKFFGVSAVPGAFSVSKFEGALREKIALSKNIFI